MAFTGMDISMVKREYRNMAAIIMRVRTTSESRESEGAQDMSMMGAYSSDMIKMVRIWSGPRSPWVLEAA